MRRNFCCGRTIARGRRVALILAGAACVMAATLALARRTASAQSPSPAPHADLSQPVPSEAVLGQGTAHTPDKMDVRVLCLHSHAPDDAYTRLQSEGFFESLRGRAPGLVVTYREYLFLTLRGGDAAYRDALIDLLRKRYEGVKLSLVFITDTRALEFWLQHLRPVFPDVPAVFSGSYTWFPELDDPRRNITGAMEKIDFAGTLRLIKELMPGVRRVAVTNTANSFGGLLKTMCEEQIGAEGNAGVDLVYLRPITWDALLAAFQGSERADALVFVAGPPGLTPGQPRSVPQWLQEQIPGGAPVFALHDAVIGPGVIGGMLCSGRRMGRLAGEAAARVLFDGTHPADIPIDRGEGAIVPMFHWDAMTRWGIDESQLPAGSVVLARPDSWFDRHRVQVFQTAAVAMSVIAGSLAAVTWGLVVSRRRRARAEAAHHAAAQRLASLIRNAPLAVIEWDDQWRCRRWDGMAQAIFGWRAEEAIGCSFHEWDLVHKDDRESVAQRTRDQERERAAVFTSTIRNVTRDGKEILCEWTNTNLFDPDGRRVATLSMVADITERARAASMLEQSEERYRLVARAVSDIVWDWNPETDELHWSNADRVIPTGGIAGRAPSIEDWIGNVHADDRERVRRSFFGAVRDPEAQVWQDEYRHKKDDGTIGVFVDRGLILRDAAGRAVRMVGAMTDVTASRAAAQRLAESEYRLKAALIAAGLGTFDADLVSGALQHDDRTAELFGLQPGERIPTFEARKAYFHPDDAEKVNKAEGEALAGGHEYRCEARVRCAEGGYRWILGQAVILRDSAGRPVRAVGVVGDINERRAAEETLRRSETKFRRFAETIDECFWEGRPEAPCCLKYVSPAVERVYGMTAEQVYASPMGWKPAVHPDDRATEIEAFERWASSGYAGDLERQYRVLHQDGRVRWVLTRGYAVRDEKGAVVAVVGSSQDVTARVDAMLRLEESEARFREIADTIPQVFWTADPGPDGPIRYVSHAVKETFGIDRDRVVGTEHGWADLIHPEDRARADRTRIAWHENGCVGSYENQYRIVRHDGEVRHILNRGYAVRDETGAIQRIAGLAEDITDRVCAQAELERTLASQRLLLSELDHRVKNNLAGLLALIELNAARQPDVRRFAEAIQRRVASMASLHAVLSASRWEPVELTQLIRALIPSDAPGTISLRGPSCLVPASRATATGMVIHELLSNSMKYGALGVPGGQVRLSWNADPTGDGARVTLSWHESGGPPIEAPPAPGLGTSLIEGFTRFELRGGAEFTYPRSGAVHRIEINFVGEDARHRTGSRHATDHVGAALL